ncbi:hypothetical protein [Sphingomonas sp. 1P08PE]|uniref:hypothetical protein n=1 Tax=Sphingomonas sp. 1P08PE TaxID=554122 RepID=UPI00399F7EB9
MTMPNGRTLASFAELARPTGAEGVGTKRGSLAAVVEGLPLDARAHGVTGDGRTDDTAAAQAFLDHCAAHGGRIAWFGSLCVRITGPLTSRGVGIVFDPASYGAADAPGFVAAGSGYTALTVIGSVADFCVTVTGEGHADITEDGKLERDRRPRINGIAFGTDRDTMGMSTVRMARVNNLAGFGVRHAQCWDSTFLSISVERCGVDGTHAFIVAGDAERTCNETSWLRVQVEQPIGGAIWIDPGVLSCSFVKIHSERALARKGVPTWMMGGSCTYDSVRLTAHNPAEATALIVSNQADFRNLRAEGVPVSVNAGGGVVNLQNPGATLQPAAGQNGTVNVIGGTISVMGMGGGWNLFGCRVSRMEIGFMPNEVRATATGCTIAELVAQPGAIQGELILSASRVEAAAITGNDGRLRALHLHQASQLVPRDGTLTCTDQMVTVDATSQIIGNVVLERAGFRLAGTVTGDLTVRGAVHDARADDGGRVGGRISGWGAPTVGGTTGAWSVNLQPEAGRIGQRPVIGWRHAAGDWRPVRMDIER